ncbi:MAG: efflux RND transporter periplasmic adaptor subunit [Rhodopirellula sp. JB044]|uniref:efflux RND transporter periplasmic adaptor subunit n=1 Tax=Rhodopirellula sp. JB044 TaxID=3342844 RepID=UPI00370A25AC
MPTESESDTQDPPPSPATAEMPQSDALPPRSIASVVVNVVVSVAVLAACLFGYTFLGERKRPQRTKPKKAAVTVVTTEALVPHQGTVEIQANGVVVPLREIKLATEVAGRIIEQSPNLRAGRIVDRDEVLIRLDPVEYQIEVERLRAQAAQEKSELTAADVGIENTKQLTVLAEQQLQIAGEERQRIGSLVNRQAASASEVDIARRAELSARAALVELQNRRRELTAAKQLIVDKQALTAAALKRAELDLKRCTVRSPIRGIVVSSTVEEQSFVSTGTDFVTIEDISAVEVRANLTADQMIWIWSSRGTQKDSLQSGGPIPRVPATITSEFGAEEFSWPAVLERIDGAGIEPTTRTYPCLFRVDVPESAQSSTESRRLTRGLFVGVSIAADPDRSLYQVSENAIRPGDRVWLNVDGKLNIVPVTLVSRAGRSVIVELATEPAARKSIETAGVIVSPISDPTEGMPVGTLPQNPKSTSPNAASGASSATTLTHEHVEPTDLRSASAAKVDG